MKKIILLLIISATIFNSCKEFDPLDDPFVGVCIWDSSREIFIDDLQLGYPSGLSSFHLNQIPLDLIERQLLNIFWAHGELGPPSKAQISVNVKSNGITCTGESTQVFKENAPEVGISSVNVFEPSNASFFGEVVIGIRTDTFINFVGTGNYYHVMWSVAGEIITGTQIPGNTMGTKIPYTNSDGSSKAKVVSKDGCFWKNGTKICM